MEFNNFKKLKYLVIGLRAIEFFSFLKSLVWMK